MSDTPPISVPVLFSIQPPPAVVPIQKDAKMLAQEKRARTRAHLKARLADAKVYETLGGKVLKLSAKTINSVGTEVTALGFKNIGHGKIFIAGDHATTAIGECDAIIADLRAQDPPVDPDRLIGMMQVKLGLIRALMDSGELHIKAGTQAESAPNGKAISIPFPANHNLGIAFTPVKPPVDIPS